MGVPLDRGETGGGDHCEGDEEERDRRMLEEIKRRMDNRKASKEQGTGRTAAKDLKARTSGAAPLQEKESRKSIEEAKKSGAKAVVSRHESKKTSSAHTSSKAAVAAQRKEAIQWASSAASETAIVKNGATEKESTRSKVIPKELSDKACTATLDEEDSLAVQDFVASQFPPVEEVVSSTVRLGRALVSGALEMRTDDPIFFETAVKLPECVVVLQSSRKKAKMPVSAAPPNSIDSEVDGNESGDVVLFQSATDVGVCIELPEGAVEPTTTERISVEDLGDSSIIEKTGTLAKLVMVETPVVTLQEVVGITESREKIVETSRGKDKGTEGREIIEIRKPVTAEAQRILQEIDRAKLLQEERLCHPS